MPIKVIKNLPAITKLAQENIFVMDTERAETQQIRPLHILLINFCLLYTSPSPRDS